MLRYSCGNDGILIVEQLDEPTALKGDTCCVCYSDSCERIVAETSKATKTKAAIIKAFSSCVLYYSYSYATAVKASHHNPVTNVPVKCPHCTEWIYQYLLGVHCAEKHTGCCA
eukprot:106175_1